MPRPGPALWLLCVAVAVAASGCSGAVSPAALQSAPPAPSVALALQGSAPLHAVWQVHAEPSAVLQAFSLWYGQGQVEGTDARLLHAVDPPRLAGTEPLELPAGSWAVRAQARFADGSTAWSKAVLAPLVPATAAPLQRFSAGPDQAVVDQDGDGRERVVLAGEAQTRPGQALVATAWSGPTGPLGPALTQAIVLPLGIHEFTFEARYAGDGAERTVQDTVAVRVVGNTPPAAVAAGAAEAWDGDGDGVEVLFLQGTASDSRGTVSAAWLRNGIRVLDRAAGNVTLPMGHHQLVFEVTDEGGQKATSTLEVDVRPNRPPVPHAGGAARHRDQDGDGRHTLTLDATLSADPDGRPLSFRWLIGTQQLGTGAVLDWQAPVGLHELTLEVTDQGGASARTGKQAHVLPPAPPFAAALQWVCFGLDCHFDASGSTGAAPLAFAWSLDGEPLEATSASVSLTLAPGPHTVEVDVTDADGRTGSQARELEARPDLPLAVSSSAFPDGGEIPEAYGCQAAGADGLLFQVTGFHQAVGIPPPPLAFTLPSDARWLAFTIVDTVPDFAHWVVWNVAVPHEGVVEVPSGSLPQGAVQGSEDASGNVGYFPVCGFPSTGIHPFVFTAYALREPLSLPAGSTRQAMLAAITPENLVGTASYLGTYENHVCEPSGAGILPSPIAGPVLAQAWATFGVQSNGMSRSCVYTP